MNKANEVLGQLAAFGVSAAANAVGTGAGLYVGRKLLARPRKYKTKHVAVSANSKHERAIVYWTNVLNRNPNASFSKRREWKQKIRMHQEALYNR